MKRVLTTMFLFLIILLNLNAKSFEVGENILYDVYAEIKNFGIKGKVGYLESKIMAISNVRGVQAYHIYARVYNTGAAKAIYMLDDTFEIWVNTNTFEALEIRKKAHEGDWTNMEYSTCYLNEGYYIYNDKRNKDKKIDVAKGLTFDALGLIYYMRFIGKAKIASFRINWAEGSKVRENIKFDISIGPKTKTKLSKEPIDTYRIRENSKYGTDALVSKYYNELPLDVIVAEQKIYGITLRVRGILKSYNSK